MKLKKDKLYKLNWKSFYSTLEDPCQEEVIFKAIKHTKGVVLMSTSDVWRVGEIIYFNSYDLQQKKNDGQLTRLD